MENLNQTKVLNFNEYLEKLSTYSNAEILTHMQNQRYDKMEQSIISNNLRLFKILCSTGIKLDYGVESIEIRKGTLPKIYLGKSWIYKENLPFIQHLPYKISELADIFATSEGFTNENIIAFLTRCEELKRENALTLNFWKKLKDAFETKRTHFEGENGLIEYIKDHTIYWQALTKIGYTF